MVILGAGASIAACPHGDRNGRRLPAMASLVDVVGLGPLLDSAGISADRRSNFEELYSSISAEERWAELRSTLELKITEYFDGIEIPRTVTVYDQLLLSMRRKDLIASFNWDPLLIAALHRNRHLRELPEVVFLHGNVGMGVCLTDRKTGYFGGRCGVCSEPYERSKLLYPVAAKNYAENPVIANQWGRLELKLREAFMVTIFGYSAPVSDVKAREIMQLAWNANGTRTLAELQIVDIRPSRDLVKSWQSFVTGDHYSTKKRITETLLLRFPRRSCDAWGWAVLQNDPWNERPLPKFQRLDRLQRWCEPLIAEELEYYEHGAPLTHW
ncbi:MAG TPA: hypothetical protein VJ901_15265 [Thermoanaerobaculia bacterium]|nr:hypothetical protein [Thermoanaerobaculia bacterium]